VQPYLWSDDLVYGYIDDAQKQFCRDTYGIPDARSFKVNIRADGTVWYRYDPRILKIRAATLADTGRKVPIVPFEKMDAFGYRFNNTTGPLAALITGLEANVFRAVPIPNQVATINLAVFRLPADAGPGDDLEIEPRHQLGLLHWVKHRAYAVQDTETYDKKASEGYLAKHVLHCARALEDQSRGSHEVGTVIYGGI
jgi:hypothetical protein